MVFSKVHNLENTWSDNSFHCVFFYKTISCNAMLYIVDKMPLICRNQSSNINSNNNCNVPVM